MMLIIERGFALFPPLLKAMPITLILTVIAAIFGLLIGLLAAIGQCSSRRFISFPAWVYTTVFRGTPALVQIYLIYYGLAELLPNPWTSSLRDAFFWPFLKEGFWFALLALILNQGAYNAEILKGAMKSLPPGQIDAARILGMTRWQVLRRIILPLTIKQCYPMLVSDVIALLKTTALASTITVMDIMGTTRMLQRQTALIYEPLIAAAIIYLAIVFILIQLAKCIEHRWFAYPI